MSPSESTGSKDDTPHIYSEDELMSKLKADLQEICTQMEVEFKDSDTKADLVKYILEREAEIQEEQTNAENGVVPEPEEVVVKAKKKKDKKERKKLKFKMPKFRRKDKVAGDKKPGKLKVRVTNAKANFKALPPKKKKVAVVAIAAILLLGIFLPIFVLDINIGGKKGGMVYAPEHAVGTEWMFRSTGGWNLKFRIHDVETNENGSVDFYNVHAWRYNDYGTLAILEEPRMEAATLDLFSEGSLVYSKYQFPLYDGKTWEVERSGTYGPYTLHFTVDYIADQWYPRFGSLDIYRVSVFGENSDGTPNLNRPFYVWDYAPEIGLEAEVNVLSLGMHFKYQLVGLCTEDADGDEMSDLAEWYFGTDPENSDTDGDGAIDGVDINPHVDISYDFSVSEVAARVNGDPGLIMNPPCDIHTEIFMNTEKLFNKQVTDNNNVAKINFAQELNLDDDVNAGKTKLGIKVRDTDNFGEDDSIDIHPNRGVYDLVFEFTAAATADLSNEKFEGSDYVPGHVILTIISNHPSEKVVPVTWEDKDNMTGASNTYGMPEEEMEMPFIYGGGESPDIADLMVME